jgi:hypothetical protein
MIPQSDPAAEFFRDADTALAFMQGSASRLLELVAVTVRYDGNKAFYTIRKDGRDVVQAEYVIDVGTMIWRGGDTTKRQDAFIKVHAILFVTQ